MSRPIDVGAVIRTVFRIYVDQAPVLMPAAAVLVVITGVLLAVLTSAGGVGLVVAGVVVSLVALQLFAGIVVELVADVRAGRTPASPRRLLRAVAPMFGELVLAGLAVAILESVGLLVFAVVGHDVTAIGGGGRALAEGLILLFVVLSLAVMTFLSLVAPVVVMERPGGLRALLRSRTLVKGHGWQVFAVIFVLVIGVLLCGSLISAAAEGAGAAVGLVVRVAIGVLSAPLSALGAAVLYFELTDRERSPVPAGDVGRDSEVD